MALYRLLKLDHRMMTSESCDLACDDDEAAEAEATELARACRAVEVWCGTRLVTRVQYQSLPSWRSSLGAAPTDLIDGGDFPRMIPPVAHGDEVR